MARVMVLADVPWWLVGVDLVGSAGGVVALSSFLVNVSHHHYNIFD